MTTPGSAPPPQGYAAFLSYRSTSTAQAKRVRKALLALARRHRPDDEFRVFLDTSSLLVGALTTEITDALEHSEHLVVLLAADTPSSVWVAREIEHWLHHGGTVDRLFLVRLDGALDLTWDEAAAAFAHPDQVPEPLRAAFATEQKWVDLAAAGSGINEASLAPLYAAIAGVDTSVLLLEEAEYQRRRRRVVAGAVGLMAVLLVLSLVGGALALVSRNEAGRQRDAARASETRAQAEADAAAALLAVPASYSEAISTVVAAADKADTPNVRSAMLSVAADTGHLLGAYASTTHGTDLSEAAFGQDGQVLATWGASGTDTTRVQVHDLTNRKTVLDTELDIAGMTELRAMSRRHLVACGADGVFDVVVGAGTPSVTSVVATAGEQDCRLVQLDDGSVVAGLTGPGGQTAAYIPVQGDPSVADGVGTIAAGPDSAIVSGPGGSWVMSQASTHQLSTTPALGSGWGDSDDMFVQTGDSSWAMAYRFDDWQLTPVPVGAGAVDAAPVVDSSMTGNLAWITDDGYVGWTGDHEAVQLGGKHRSKHSWRTRIVPLESGVLLAVWGQTASLLVPPGYDATGSDWTTLDNGWKYQTVEQYLGAPDTTGEDPVFAECAHGGQVAIRTTGGSGELVDTTGETTYFSDPLAFGPTCEVVTASDGLELQAVPGSSSSHTIRPDYLGQSVQLARVPNTGQLRAVLQARGVPTEVLSLDDTATPGPWGFRPTGAGRTTALGERRVAIATDSYRGTDDVRLLLVSAKGTTSAGDLPPGSRLVAVRPDGYGAVTEVPLGPGGATPRTLVDRDGTATADPACAGQPVRYLPGAGYQTSVAAAEAQIPAADVDGSWSDCRPGTTSEATQDLVTSYGVGAAHGLIVATTEAGTLQVVSWAHGDTRPDVVTAPPGSDAEHLGVDPDGRTAVTVDDHRTVHIWSRRGAGWLSTQTLASSLADPVSVSLVDRDSLVLLVAGDGEFELLDAASGRRLVSNHAPVVLDSGSITGVQTTVRDGYLYAYWQLAGQASDSDVVDIPIEIPVLRSLLCQLYAAPSCSS